MGKRGYVPEDEKQFKGQQLEYLKKAADEVQFLLDQGYDIKPATTFVGNHYMFSERQRLALARSVSAREWSEKRNRKELLQKENEPLPQMVHINGFNTIITLEVALSGSPVFYLDSPVSNSGRLSSLIWQCADKYNISIETQIIPDVDRSLEQLEGVISGDAIILNRCISWLNIMPEIVGQIDSIWKIQL